MNRDQLRNPTLYNRVWATFLVCTVYKNVVDVGRIGACSNGLTWWDTLVGLHIATSLVEDGLLLCLREVKGKGSPYSITQRRVPELIPVLGSQRAGDVSHKPGGRLPLLSTRPAITPATLKRAATNFAAW